jgi:hypothetical protein
MRWQLIILNWRGKLKRKIKFTKDSKQKIKIKWIRIRFEKITNHNYGLNEKIKNKLKFN